MKRKTNSLICVLLLLFSTGYAQTILTIDQAIELAMLQSPSMKNVQLSLSRSQEMLNAQRAALKSNFSLSLKPVSYSQGNSLDTRDSKWYYSEQLSSDVSFNVVQPILPTDGTITLTNEANFTDAYSEEEINSSSSERFSNNLSLAINQPIFTYNKLKLKLKELELDVENSYLNFGLQKLQVEQTVSQQFYKVYQNQQSLEISKEELKNTQESYNIIKSKVEGGLQALEELYQAELNLANSNSSVYNAEVTLQNSIDNFCVALALPFDTEIIIMANIEAEPTLVDVKNATSLALENRSELRQREIDIQTSQFGMITTKAENEFKGSIQAKYGFNYSRYFDASKATLKNTESNRRTPSITANLEIPLFDWGEKRAKIKAQQASIDLSYLSMQNEKIDIELNIRSTIRSLNNLRSQIDIQKKSLQNAELTYDINLERYKNGDLTGMDLNLYQNQLSSAKMSLTGAIIDYKLELLNLKVQTLYDFTKQESIVPEEFKMTSFKK